jgi:hypothetical protein
MKFRTADEKNRTVSIQPCKEGLTESEVKAAMDEMISSGAFVYEPTEKVGATVTERAVSVIF